MMSPTSAYSPAGRLFVLASLLMAGCASPPPAPYQADRISGASQPSQQEEGMPPATTLKPITPELLATQGLAAKQQTADDVLSLMGRHTPYEIGHGDVLSIVVWDHPELSNAATIQAAANAGTGADASSVAATAPPAGFLVERDGTLYFPYAGNIHVAGLTQDQARKLLAEKLARYIKSPKVTLRVQSFRSKKVYIDGEVKAPGMQALNDVPMTLVEALNRAGGVLPSGDQSQIALGRGSAVYRINMPQLVARGINPADILLADGDVIRVRSRDESKVFVSGEVVSPRALTMHHGSLTLNEALGESGGINPASGDTGQVYVVRRNDNGQEVFQLDGRSPGALAMAEGFALKPRDVVYVAATPLVNWHRAISLFFPSALSGAIGAVTPALPK